MVADLCIVAIFLLFVLNGYRSGLIKSVYSMLSLIATVVLVSLLKDSFIQTMSVSPVGIYIGKLFAGSMAEPLIVELCSRGVIYIVSLIILYFLIRFVLKFALTIINSIASLPIIRTLNKFFGLILGAAIGVLWIVVIVSVLSNIPQTSKYIEESYIISYFKIIFV